MADTADPPPTDLDLLAALLDGTATVGEACRLAGVAVPDHGKHITNTLAARTSAVACEPEPAADRPISAK